MTFIPPLQRNPDGSYTKAEPLPPQGWKARVEHRLFVSGRLPLVRRFLGWWDERGLGR